MLIAGVSSMNKGSSEIVLTCPECEKETMKRQVGLSSFQLKGGGWYKDGYTKKPKWYIWYRDVGNRS